MQETQVIFWPYMSSACPLGNFDPKAKLPVVFKLGEWTGDGMNLSSAPPACKSTYKLSIIVFLSWILGSKIPDTKGEFFPSFTCICISMDSSMKTNWPEQALESIQNLDFLVGIQIKVQLWQLIQTWILWRICKQVTNHADWVVLSQLHKPTSAEPSRNLVLLHVVRFRLL